MRCARLVPFIALVALPACVSESTSPTAPSDVELTMAPSGQSGCYAVEGQISETGLFPNFAGVITGDIVGTTATLLGFAGVNGVVIRNPGVRTINVTGGSVPSLIGQTLHETFEGLSIDDGADLVRINERTRVESGALLGNLTTHGTLNLAVFPWEVELTYRGVLCP